MQLIVTSTRQNLLNIQYNKYQFFVLCQRVSGLEKSLEKRMLKITSLLSSRAKNENDSSQLLSTRNSKGGQVHLSTFCRNKKAQQNEGKPSCCLTQNVPTATLIERLRPHRLSSKGARRSTDRHVQKKHHSLDSTQSVGPKHRPTP